MKLLPENPTQSDYLHAIRAVAARGDMNAVPKRKEVFNLADAGMFADTGATNVKPMGSVTICRNGYIQEVEQQRDAAFEILREVVRKDEEAIKELAAIMDDYEPEQGCLEIHARIKALIGENASVEQPPDSGTPPTRATI